MGIVYEPKVKPEDCPDHRIPDPHPYRDTTLYECDTCHFVFVVKDGLWQPASRLEKRKRK